MSIRSIALLFGASLLFFNCSNGQEKSGTQETPADSTQLPHEPPPISLAQQAREAGFDKDYLTGNFEPAEHPDFVRVSSKYADREGLYLREDTYQAFLQLREAAAAAGHTLVIRSATRNFDYQKGIWERKWNGQRTLSSGENAAEAYPDPKERALQILKYSSMPGTSRHHWGTDFDINAFNNEYFESGKGKALYEWMAAHAHEYGFCQPYTPKGEARPHGYNEEKWHWSYMPIAQPLTALAEEELENRDISGFAGADVAESLLVVQRYVLGVSPNCLP